MGTLVLQLRASRAGGPDPLTSDPYHTYAASPHLGLGVYLGPPVQQQSHHDDVAPPGGDVQRGDAVLQHRTREG